MNGNPSLSRLLDVRLVGDRGEQGKGHPAQDRRRLGDGPLPRPEVVEHHREQLLDDLRRCTGPKGQAGPAGQRLAGDNDGERMSPRERPDPHGVVATDSVGGKEPVDVIGPTTSSPSRVRHPGAVRQAAFGPRRPTSRVVTPAGRARVNSLRIQPSSRLSRSKLSITRTSTPAAAIHSAAAVADCGGGPPSAVPSAASAPGTVGSV